MLLQRGHGSTLSGFFRVLSCDGLVVVASLWSPFLEDFSMEVSLSVEGVLGFSVVVLSSFSSIILFLLLKYKKYKKYNGVHTDSADLLMYHAA